MKENRLPIFLIVIVLLLDLQSISLAAESEKSTITPRPGVCTVSIGRVD
jgi:hypothetical protein